MYVRAEQSVARRHGHEEANELAIGSSRLVVLAAVDACTQHRASQWAKQLKIASDEVLQRDVWRASISARRVMQQQNEDVPSFMRSAKMSIAVSTRSSKRYEPPSRLVCGVLTRWTLYTLKNNSGRHHGDKGSRN